MPSKVVDTSIEALVSYLKEHGETDSESLLKALNVDHELLNEWANALEAAKVVKIRYKFAKMFLAPVATQKDEEAEMIETGIVSAETFEEARNLLARNAYDAENSKKF